jgi:hypothetical protein
MAETTVERLLCCGFRRTGKATGQVYQCWWRICRETNVSSRFEYHMFYDLCPFVTYLLTFRRNYLHREQLYLRRQQLLIWSRILLQFMETESS